MDRADTLTLTRTAPMDIISLIPNLIILIIDKDRLQALRPLRAAAAPNNVSLMKMISLPSEVRGAPRSPLLVVLAMDSDSGTETATGTGMETGMGMLARY